MMYTKLASGETYDVLVPSDYMIERLIKEEYLQALDWKKIPNSKNLLPEVQNKDYDPGNRYSSPLCQDPPERLQDRKSTRLTVVYETFESNEMMYTKLALYTRSTWFP